MNGIRELEFRMERPDLVHVGDEVEVRESVLKTLQGTMYYYTIHPAIAMSGNLPARERLTVLHGKVSRIEDYESHWSVFCAFDETI